MIIKCPIPQCGQENTPDVARCPSCGANLQAYSRLLLMPDDLFNRGLSFAQGGHFQQAEQCLQVALFFNPRDFEAMLLLAQVQALQGDNVAATTTFVRVLEKGTSDPRLMNMTKTLQAALGQTTTGAPLVVEAAGASQPAKRSSRSTSAKHKRKKKQR